MTPERYLQALANDIHVEVAMLEGQGQTELLTNDFAAYEATKAVLVAAAKVLGINLEKYG